MLFRSSRLALLIEPLKLCKPCKKWGRLAVAGMSYCWETREHPDPEGNSLLALADALESELLISEAAAARGEIFRQRRRADAG